MLFLCGLHRSGKTIAEAWLHAHFRLCRLRAPVPDNEGQHLQDIYAQAFVLGGPGRFALNPRAVRAVPMAWRVPLLRRRLLRQWTPWVQGDEPVLIEKSPPNVVNIPFLRRLFPGARFVLVTRHPLAVAAETESRRQVPAETALENWQAAMALARVAHDPADCALLRYEDLCAAPMAEIARIAAWAGLERRVSPHPLPRWCASLRPAEVPPATITPLLPGGIWEGFGYRRDGSHGATAPGQSPGSAAIRPART